MVSLLPHLLVSCHCPLHSWAPGALGVCVRGVGAGSQSGGERKWESIYYTKHLPTALGVLQSLLPRLAMFVSPYPPGLFPHFLYVLHHISSHKGPHWQACLKCQYPAKPLRRSFLLPNTTHLSTCSVNCLPSLEHELF